MAKQVITKLIDDLDKSLEADQTVKFGLGDDAFEIDLASNHAEELRSALAPYISAARRVGKLNGHRHGTIRVSSGSGGSKSTSKPNSERNRRVREWWKASEGKIEGLPPFTTNGRIRQKVFDLYDRHNGVVPKPSPTPRQAPAQPAVTPEFSAAATPESGATPAPAAKKVTKAVKSVKPRVSDDEIREVVKQAGVDNITAIADATGLTETTVKRRMANIPELSQPADKSTKKAGGRKVAATAGKKAGVRVKKK